jgi:hypothetical protein
MAEVSKRALSPDANGHDQALVLKKQKTGDEIVQARTTAEVRSGFYLVGQKTWAHSWWHSGRLGVPACTLNHMTRMSMQ